MPDSPATARPGVRDLRRPTPSGVGFAHLCGGLVLGIGLLTVLGALFQPWLASGPATRNSFQLMALAERYRFVDAWWYRSAPDVWPFWVPAVGVTAVLLALRLRRIAGAMGAMVGMLAVAAGSLVLGYGSGRSTAGVRLVDLGPTTLVIGGATCCAGAVALFLKSSTRLHRDGRS